MKAAGATRETLLPTSVEITALQLFEEMRLLSQSAVDNHSVVHPHESIDESRVSTDDGSPGGSSRPRRHWPPLQSEIQVQTVVDHDQRRIESAVGGLSTLLPV